jgi:diaminopimelate decarboxylase
VKTPKALDRFRDRPPVVVLDSEADLLRVARHLPGARVLLRVNPDLPVQTHDHLATGRGESQFGVLPEEAPGLLQKAEELGLEVLGLHLHLGSSLERPEDFLEGYRVLEGLQKRVGPQRVLDLGGGFGLGLDLEGLSPAVEDLARLYGAEVWLEPGRRLVARSGVLVAGIWGVKRTRRTYLLLDAGLLPGRKHRVDRLPTPPPLRGAPPRPAPVRGRGGGRV